MNNRIFAPYSAAIDRAPVSAIEALLATGAPMAAREALRSKHFSEAATAAAAHAHTRDADGAPIDARQTDPRRTRQRLRAREDRRNEDHALLLALVVVDRADADGAQATLAQQQPDLLDLRGPSAAFRVLSSRIFWT
jgi:hypothetical protein